MDLPVAWFLSSAPSSAPVPSGPLRPALGKEVTKCRTFRRPLAVICMEEILMVKVSQVVLQYLI